MDLSDDDPVTLRDAADADAEGIARLFDEGSQGLLSFLAGTPLSAGMVARMVGPSMADPAHPLHVGNAVVAVDGGTLAGMAIAHPAEQRTLDDHLRALVSGDRLTLLAPLQQARVEGSLFLAALCVARRWRRRGIGTTLIEAVKARARALGRPRVSALVTTRNDAARSLLRREGFAVSRVVSLAPDTRLPGSGELFLMAAPSGAGGASPPPGG